MSGRRVKALRRYVRSKLVRRDTHELAAILQGLRGRVRRRFVERAAVGRVLTTKERGHR